MPKADSPAAAPPRRISFHNHQRDCPVRLAALRPVAEALLHEHLHLPAYDLEVSLLADPAMTRLNEQFVHHAGTTDVITFDYAEPASPAAAAPDGIQGEIFLCPAEAVRQAARYHTTWQAELVRYLVHGVLHLLGHDDLEPEPRRRMKRVENQLVEQLAAGFDLNGLARPSGGRP